MNHFEWIKKNAASYFNINSLQELEIFHTQLPHLLRYEDKNSMRHSIETRLPFLDYRLLETALSLPSSYKIQNGWTKYILRKSMQKIVPYDILWRKNKLGFNAPENTWIDAIKDNMIQEIGNSRLIQNISKDTFSLKKSDKKTLWRLYSIAKWENIYNVNFSSI